MYNKKRASAVGGTEPGPTEAEVAAAALSEQHTIVNQAAASGELRTRLLLDCMGHFSDIVKQLRVGTAPHGMCLVVGSCAEGIPEVANKSGDLLYTFSDAELDMQMFWEAFPAEGGKSRTTYMFTYTGALPWPRRLCARPTSGACCTSPGQHILTLSVYTSALQR